MDGAPSLLSPHSRSHWLGLMNLAGRNPQAASPDWAELMSQKIPKLELQGSPWASGLFQRRREDELCFYRRSGAFCGLGGVVDVTLREGDSIESDWCVTGWGRDYPALITKACPYQGPQLTARCPLSIKLLPTPHQAAPKVWNVPPILSLLTPSHSRPTAEGLSERRAWPTQRSSNGQ